MVINRCQFCVLNIIVNRSLNKKELVRKSFLYLSPYIGEKKFNQVKKITFLICFPFTVHLIIRSPTDVTCSNFINLWGQISKQSQSCSDFSDFYLHITVKHNSVSRQCCGIPDYECEWASAEHYDKVLVSPKMFSDHMPDAVMRALDQLESRDHTPMLAPTRSAVITV